MGISVPLIERVLLTRVLSEVFFVEFVFPKLLSAELFSSVIISLVDELINFGFAPLDSCLRINATLTVFKDNFLLSF